MKKYGYPGGSTRLDEWDRENRIIYSAIWGAGIVLAISMTVIGLLASGTL